MTTTKCVILLVLLFGASRVFAAASYDIVGPKTVIAMQAETTRTSAAAERQFPLDLGKGISITARFRLEANGTGVFSTDSLAITLIRPNSKGELPVEPLQTRLVDLNKDGVKDLLVWGAMPDTSGKKQQAIAGFNFDAASKKWKNSFTTPEIEYSLAGNAKAQPQ